MGILTDWITDWIKELLIDGIMGNLDGLFETVNTQVGEISVQVGTTPTAWNAGVFSLIRQLSETVILPIAGLILTFVATYELIQLILERNNLHDIETAVFFKWIFKTCCAILILSNTFNIVMAVFDVSQNVIAQSAGLIQGSTDVTPG
ncbi:MAG: CD0415/CD1112 family protein, partial [Oscillibacter sp.]